jgi:hypothetical protein
MAHSKYPWDRWSDGQTWMVEQGSEFTCYGRSFAAAAHLAAKVRKLKVTSSVFAFDHKPDIVIFVFYDGEGLWKPNMTALPTYRELMDELGRHYR